jgi:hypothetical protein
MKKLTTKILLTAVLALSIVPITASAVVPHASNPGCPKVCYEDK